MHGQISTNALFLWSILQLQKSLLSLYYEIILSLLCAIYFSSFAKTQLLVLESNAPSTELADLKRMELRIAHVLFRVQRITGQCVAVMSNPT